MSLEDADAETSKDAAVVDDDVDLGDDTADDTFLEEEEEDNDDVATSSTATSKPTTRADPVLAPKEKPANVAGARGSRGLHLPASGDDASLGLLPLPASGERAGVRRTRALA